LHLVARFQRQEVLLLCRQQVRAVQREERLSFLNRLPRVIHVQIADPSLYPYIYVRLARLVVPDHADRTQCLLDGGKPDRHDTDTKQRLTSWIDRDRAAWRSGGCGGCRLLTT